MDAEIDEGEIHDGADLHNGLLLSQRLNLGRRTPENHIIDQAYAIWQRPAALNSFSAKVREQITNLASDTIKRAQLVEEAKQAARQQQLFFDDLLAQGSLTVLINGCPVQIGIDALAQAIAKRLGIERLRKEIELIDNRTGHLMILR